MAWLESRRSKDGRVTWFVYWREAGRGTAKRCLNAGRRRRDADRLAIEIQARLNAGLVGGAIVARRIRFDDFVEKWVALRMARPTTLRRDTGLIDTHLRPMFSGRMLYAITVEDVRTLLAKVVKQRSASTVLRLLSVLNQILVDAARNDYIRRNPIAQLTRWDKPRLRKVHRTADLGVICEILRTLPNRWSTFVLVAVLTGLRWGEIVALEWSDVDFDNRTLHVRRAIPAGTHEADEPKSPAARRTIDMLWPVWETLSAMSHPHGYVFPGIRGGPLSYAWFTKHVWRSCSRSLSDRRVRFHDLRHTFASLLFAWQEPVLYISQQLGHSDSRLALATYGHLLEQGRRVDKERVLDQMFQASQHRSGIRAHCTGAVPKDVGSLPPTREVTEAMEFGTSNHRVADHSRTRRHWPECESFG